MGIMFQNLNLSTIFELHRQQPQFVILDIDSTLLTTYQRNQVILEEFCKHFAADHPEQVELLRQAQCKLGDYGYYTSLERLDKKPNDPVFLSELETFWRKNFFSNNFLHADVPTEGAVDFVQQLESSKIPFAYLTGRFKKTMWEGTLKSLETLGFPINRNQLILKEDPKQADETYKSKSTSLLKNQFSQHQFWLIDNEPMILHEIIKDHSDVHLIWFDSCHSGKKQPPENVPAIKRF